MTAVQYVLETRDFDELAHALRGWDARFQQFTRGPFQGSLHLVQTGDVQLIRVRANRKILARGTLRQGSYSFTAIQAHNAGAVWRGRHLVPGQVNINQPDGVMDHLTAAPYESLILSVESTTLQERAHLYCGMDAEERLRGFNAIRVNQETTDGLAGFLRGIFERLRPDAAKRHLDIGAEIESVCLTHLLETVSRSERFLASPPRNIDRLALVRRVEEYLLAHLNLALSATDLCREFDVSERTLRYAFREVYDLSPMAYFKTARLNAVRQALKQHSRRASVHEIAELWNFDHTGNFASDYHRHFGELPSRTLAG